MMNQTGGWVDGPAAGMRYPFFGLLLSPIIAGAAMRGRLKAVRFLHQLQMDALVVIGGNGSQTGAYELSRMDFPVVGVASTIDNDLYARTSLSASTQPLMSPWRPLIA